MKKTIQTIAIAAFAISFTFTSCSKDETTTPAVTGPTVAFIDSTGTGIVDTTNFFVSSYMTLKVTPAAGTTIDAVKKDTKIDDVIVSTGTYATVSATQKEGYSETYPVNYLISQMKIPFGKKITFVITLKDSKGQTTTSEVSYNVKIDNGIITSPETELGAQANASIPNKFLGLANNFATYTSGASGTAKLNSGNIDFVYYHGPTDKNTFAAPSNADGAKIIWNSEINMWPKQNKTKFLTSTITASQFDNIKNSSKIDDQFASLDFTAGTDKITQLTVGSVYAFQTASGIRGLVKFTSVSTNDTGSTKVIIVCQN